MSEPAQDEDLLADAYTPLDAIDPVEQDVREDPGPEPPPHWGKDGVGEP